MQPLTSFYPYIEPEVMGCPYPMIDHHLILAIREFCQRGQAWREWVDAFTADGTTNQFDYDLVSGQELVKAARAIRNEDVELDILSEDELPRDWETGTSLDLEDVLVHYDDASFMVYPAPCSGDVFRIEMIFQPALSATQVGDVLLNTWAEQIAQGAKARLLRIPGKGWSDPVMAKFYDDRFEADIRKAANNEFAMRGKKGRRTKPSPEGKHTWRIPPFFS